MKKWALGLGFAFYGATLCAASPLEIPTFAFKLVPGALELVPPARSHFNTRAPAQATLGAKRLKMKLAEPSSLIELPKGAAGTVHVALYLCNDELGLCVKKTGDFSLSPGAAAEAPLAPNALPARGVQWKGFDRKSGFYVNDAEGAFAEAKRLNRPLLISFFGIWCPPCNHLEKMVLERAEFLRGTADFVRLKLDSDIESSAALKERFAIRGIPTVVFATSTGDEILRKTGSRTLKEMLRAARTASTQRAESAEALERRSKAGDVEATVRLARLDLERGDAQKAWPLVEPLKTGFEAKHDPRLAVVYEAQVRAALYAQDEAQAARALAALKEVAPVSVAVFEGYQDLAEALEGRKLDAKAAYESALAAVREFEKLPPSKRGETEYTAADLKETVADLESSLGRDAEARASYLKCADAYLVEGRAEGTAFPRGPNLERAYCLMKAGQITQAEALAGEGAKRFPEEFTYHRQLSAILLEDKKPDAALAEARKALATSYGNQRFKAVMTLAKALESLGRFGEGAQAIDRELAAFPSSGRIMSMDRLRRSLEAKRDELKKKAG